MLGIGKLSNVALLLSSAVLFTVGFNARATTSEDYEKALKSYNINEFDEAYIHLKNSLQKDPQNLAAKILMGRILLINGYLVAAEQEFIEAIEMGADINLLAEPLGNTWLFLNKYKEIINFQETTTLTGENKRNWQQTRATACTRLEDLDCSKNEYNQILENYPNYLPAINGLAAIALQQENAPLARSYVERAEQLDKENAITWRLKGQLAYLEGDASTATEYLQRALTFDREDPIALRNLVDLYLQAKDYDRARLFVAEIIQDTPNDPLAILLNSWLESRGEKEIIDNEKLQQLNEFMSQLSPELIASQPMLLYISGLTNFFNNNMEKAAKDFTAYLQREPEDIQAVMMLSQVYLATQQYKQALILLEKHQRALIENIDSALVLGDLFIRQNKAFKAERLLRSLNDRYPNNPQLQLFEIKLMAARGKQDEALAILEQNFQSNSQSSVYLFTYALMHLQTQNYTKALQGADLLGKLLPDEAEVFNLKAGILIRQGKLQEAKQNIEQALALKPTLFPAKFNLAATESRLGNVEKSNELVEELLSLSPKHTESLLLKAFNLSKTGMRDQAKQIYLEIIVLNPENIPARERLIQIYQTERDFETALYHVDRLLKDNFDNPDYLLDKASLQLTMRQQKDAQKTLGIVENFIRNDAPRLVKFSNLQMQLENPQGALNALVEAQNAAPDSTFIALSRVRLLIQLNQLTGAEAILNDLAKTQSKNANYWHSYGEFLAASGKDAQAVEAFQQALALDPNFSQPLIALYNYALRESFVEIFLSQTEDIANSYPSNLLARNLLGQYLFFIRDYARAIPIYTKLIEEPNLLNPAQAYNRLALMKMDNSLEQAAGLVEKAYDLSPSNADILDTFGWVKAQQGDYEGSLKLLREAFSRNAKDPNIRYHLGYTLAKLNRIEEAKKELSFAVNTERPFFMRPQAQQLLNSL
ncbi:PEP-CTERM system TPR-repeat protein PrsT [Alteromonas sp. D210916BOD_24]|uniref:XrtA/PEP-CTERM system TPR-repeat protein PrsT n=1 Tax=Alteromonas sp. D210916BOD_24 TaxID=3157618 RepID=UPI00399CDEF9